MKFDMFTEEVLQLVAVLRRSLLIDSSPLNNTHGHRTQHFWSLSEVEVTITCTTQPASASAREKSLFNSSKSR